jgi:hypothetical protein
MGVGPVATRSRARKDSSEDIPETREQGGNAHAIELLHANHPDWFCWWEWREPASS